MPARRGRRDRRGRSASNRSTQLRPGARAATTGASAATRCAGWPRRPTATCSAHCSRRCSGEHRNFSTLSSALKLLAVTDVDVTAPLAELLQDADADLRIQAALALGEQHQPGGGGSRCCARSRILTSNVRFHAIEALGRLRADAAVDPLLAIAGSGDFFLAFAALEALALIHDPRVASGLTPLLGESVLREAVVQAMSQLGDDHVIRPLVATLNSSPESTLVTVGALASVGDRLAREGLDVSSIVRESLSDAGRAHVLAAAAGSPSRRCRQSRGCSAGAAATNRSPPLACC